MTSDENIDSNAHTAEQDTQTLKFGEVEYPVAAEYTKREPGMAQLAASQRKEREKKVVVPTKSISYRALKRVLDIVISAIAIVICAIPGAILAIFIMRDTGGSPFYMQDRVGKGGKLFKIIKFRTMVADADNLAKYLSKDQLDEWVYEHKVTDDPRITKLGRFLRKTSIDEIPNFLNAFLGQMSIVGPRAVTPEELVWYNDDADLLLSVPAGITGLWQVRSRNTAQYETGERQELELEYVRNASLGLDIKIFFQTFAAVFDTTGK